MSIGIMIVAMACGGFLSSMLASYKNRNVEAWAAFGLLFPAISVIALLCTSTIQPPEDWRAGW